ncbi:MAG: SUMF1/EgtB/PvdO family nonheme iron enzyme [Rhodospirillaceae bacterium]|nr:SUMF1/EgtB/PvdO family nonheme iron enzyme [Rhodospirillaceae bacterium]MBT5192408.1 SUMF1/EgtB/PvdO family nonheme iron enzyme [Rhodospirillaceae bacterium]MBT6430106.1 SUMF1/EgtB/PvdO family nonheme iron enzyme [Rhodospirillaceae bacterium]
MLAMLGHPAAADDISKETDWDVCFDAVTYGLKSENASYDHKAYWTENRSYVDAAKSRGLTPDGCLSILKRNKRPGLVVRKFPSRHAAAISRLQEGAAYTVVYKAPNGWSIIEFPNGQRGAVLTKVLSAWTAEMVEKEKAIRLAEAKIEQARKAAQAEQRAVWLAKKQRMAAANAAKARKLAEAKAKAEARAKAEAAAAAEAKAVAARKAQADLARADSVRAAGQRRVALVIGNDKYASLPPLLNARTDARGMAEKLRGLGFDVILKLDASRRGFHRAIRDFSRKLRNADVGLVFYAGHGIQSEGENYLIPANAQIEVEDDLRFEAVEAGEILLAMRDAGSELNIVIMDACRDNPLPNRTRSATRGLAVTQVPTGTRGTALFYSAAPGQTAQDGPEGGHGIYTGELLKVLDQPGLKLEQVFKETARRVSAVTNGKQDPWFNSSITGDFIFNPVKAVATSVPPPARPNPNVGLMERRSAEMLFWSSIKDSSNPAAFQAYLKQYPTGPFVPLARLKLEELKPLKTAALQPATPSVRPMLESYRALKTANVRAEPTVRSERRGQIRRGERVTVTGRGPAGNWLRIEWPEGDAGYVFASLLTPAREAVKAAVKVAALQPANVKVPIGRQEDRRPGRTFRDCADCPEMVVIPPGRFAMGGRGGAKTMPRHDVNFKQGFAVAKYETTRAAFAAFVKATGNRPKGDGCYAYTGRNWELDRRKTWRKPGYRQTGQDPVVCVSWKDAKAFVTWLSRRTGQDYRLLSEAEWEYVALAGSGADFSFGNDKNQLCRHGNSADRTTAASYPNWQGDAACRDGFVHTAPVGRFRANAFGLHDMHGNVWEWLEDCWHKNYQGAPNNGRAWTTGGTCGVRAVRGGSWTNEGKDLEVANRGSNTLDVRDYDIGFRVARTMVR